MGISPKPLHQADTRLSGKISLVTGASRGIGFAIAEALAAEGCELIIAARDKNAIEAAGRELQRYGKRVVARACDVANVSDVDALLGLVQRQFGRLDILVNNAGISHPMATVDQLAPDIWERVIAANLTGMFLVTRAALPLMPSGATIVNNLSVAAKQVFAGEAAYVASKHGALGFTNTLREEMRPRGIRVVALVAGATNTEIWNQFWPEAPRANMMLPHTVAAAVISALLIPANSGVDELIINPVTGAL